VDVFFSYSLDISIEFELDESGREDVQSCRRSVLDDDN
jgi:hypothetical protein